MSETAAECPPNPEQNPEPAELCPATPPERPASAQSLPPVNPASPDCNTDSEDNERSGSPINCSICLGRCSNKCFTDACMHHFCFTCLVEWSKIKAECPLCKKPFRSIIHNVKSESNYDEYLVSSQAARIQYPYDDEINIFLQDSRRFRYRTTLELRPHESNAIQQLFSITPVVPQPPSSSRLSNIRTDGGVGWRLEIYQRSLYACPLYDITGRFRDYSAYFYRNNPAQIHRLMPWVTREVSALLQNEARASYCTGVIQNLLTRHSLYSREFREQMVPYFQLRTEHFIHEFINFARSPYDLIGYDRSVQYTPFFNSRVDPVVISSEASSSPSDISDLEELELAPRTEWTIETRSNNHTVIVSGFVGSSDEIQVGTNSNTNGSASVSSNDNNNAEDLIQTVNLNILSDTDSDECVFVKAEKPPHLRTPELVSLNSESDSDCVVIDSSFNDNKKDSELSLPSTSSGSNTEAKPKIEIIDYSMPSTSTRGLGTGSKPSTSAGLFFDTFNQSSVCPFKVGGRGFKRIFEESTSCNSSESESSHEEYKIYSESKRKKSPSVGSSPTKTIRRKKKHLSKKKESKSDSDCSSKPKRKIKSRKRVRSIKDKLTKQILQKHLTKKSNSRRNILSTSSSSDSD